MALHLAFAMPYATLHILLCTTEKKALIYPGQIFSDRRNHSKQKNEYKNFIHCSILDFVTHSVKF